MSAAALVELALHDPLAEVHHGHVHAAQHQPVGRLQAEQAGADHHRVAVLAGGLDHRLGVGDVAVGEHAGQVVAGDGRDEGRRAGGQQQAVVVGLGAVAGEHLAADAVDLHHLAAGVQGDAVVAVPVEIVEHDLGQRHLARQHRRQQDAVVVAVRLGAEHGDVVEVGRELEQLLDRAHAGHAVADQHEFHLLHGVSPQQGRLGRNENGAHPARIPGRGRVEWTPLSTRP
jgi:hypothetical protein